MAQVLGPPSSVDFSQFLVCLASFDCFLKMTLQAGPGAGGANEGLAGAKQPPCVGILKTPGRRKTSNNRVEFLDNLQEREIPGRYT